MGTVPGFLVGMGLPNHVPVRPPLRLRPTVVTGRPQVRGFNQLRNEFLTAARRVATTKKQAIGEVVEWASGGAFKYGDVGRMTEIDTSKLRTATELMASTVASTAR
jgi:hypothetical protein